MRRRHTLTTHELDYNSPSMLASASNERGSKRLMMFTNPTTKEVIFQVTSGSALREYVEIAPAIDDYNGIDV